MSNRQVILLSLLITTVFSPVYGWYTCDEKPFCQRIRNRSYGTSPFQLDLQSVTSSSTSIEASLLDAENGKILTLTLSAIEGTIFRILIADPDKVRHSVPEALDGEPVSAALQILEQTNDYVTVSSGDSSVVIRAIPLRIEVFKNGVPIVSINDDGKLTFKTEEDYDEAIALDIKFPGTQRAYGIPLHAELLSLQTTGVGGLNPYRLFNVDHCCYAVRSQEPLYGSVPVLYAHGTERTSGVFWLNSAQTFVDVNNGQNQIDTFFISESGVLDLFVLTGPTLAEATTQYTKLTGTAPLPQYFAIAFHQSRYSYMSQRDVEHVVEEFDAHNFPLDVMWLDIDYTDGMRYFTWDFIAFPNPTEMQQNLNATGRKLVVIIDPHIKVDEDYFVYAIANENGYFVKNPDGSNFEGLCWPGLSSYLDFHHPEGADWYASLYGFDSFPHATDIMHLWNDMNEPVVFDQDEETMPNYLVHYGGWLHRDVHNMYGFTQTVGTWKGLMARSDYQKRPFILTRSHFAGSQRYTAMWTGDNIGSWEHLRISFPMCLTEALAGISFCGADVGGFVSNVETELFQRWYQAGSWLPFFRSHSSSNTDRREPYLFSNEIQVVLRNALRERYVHLPTWYTIWFEHERYGYPVIRPLTYHYAADVNTLDIDDEWLVGSDILVRPVAEPGVSQVPVYLPGGFDDVWYDIEHNLAYRGVGTFMVSVTLDYIPVFYRAGSIIARKDTPRPSSVHMHDDPFTLYVFLDINQYATGNLYVDDYETFAYRNLQYSYFRFEFINELLQLTIIDEDAQYDGNIVISNVFLYRVPFRKEDGGYNGNVSVRNATKLELTDLNLNVNKPSTIKLF